MARIEKLRIQPPSHSQVRPLAQDKDRGDGAGEGEPNPQQGTETEQAEVAAHTRLESERLAQANGRHSGETNMTHPGRKALDVWRRAFALGAIDLECQPATKKQILAYVAELEEALQQIADWSAAYPETVFTEPDFKRMHQVLTEAGMPTALDAAHGTWGRRISEGVGRIAIRALKT